MRLKIPLGESDYVNASPIVLKNRTTASTQVSDTWDASSSGVENHESAAKWAKSTMDSAFGIDDVSAEESQSMPILTESRYIATQGPKDGQFEHFWHMVMQQTVGDVSVIVMLTPCYEGIREKCAQYFPRSLEAPVMVLQRDGQKQTESQGETEVLGGIQGGQLKTGLVADEDGDPFTDSEVSSGTGADLDSDGDVAFDAQASGGKPKEDPGHSDSVVQPLDVQNWKGDPQHSKSWTPKHEKDQDTVTLVSFARDPDTTCELRHLRLRIDGKEKEVRHYLFSGWPDYGKPEQESKEALVKLMKITRDIAAKEGGGDWKNPRIVHCSAGVGRTGTWIAMDWLLFELEQGVLAQPNQTPTVGGTDDANNVVKEVNRSAFQAHRQIDAHEPAEEKQETWGKSGPVKTKSQRVTPDPPSGKPDGEEEDLIYETVNTLREQRMMMVMNELQYGFIYEVVKEEFVKRYREPERGGSVVTSMRDSEERERKVARVEPDNNNNNNDDDDDSAVAQDLSFYAGTALGRVRGEEDTISDSEAETEIAEESRGREGPKPPGEDPYQAVAPESIRQGMERQL